MTEADTIDVLHVDDEPDFADLTAEFLEQADDGLVVHTATNPDDGLDLFADHDIDCVVSDHDMPGWTGIEFLQAVRDRYPALPFILYTGKGSEEVASDAISAGVTDYLQKGTGSDQYDILANRIRNAVSARRATADAAQRRHRLEQIVKTVPSCVVQLDHEGRFVFANDRAVEVLGLTQSDLTDRAYNDPEWNITDLDGDPIPEAELPFRQVRDTGEPLYDFRHTIQWADGTRRILSINGAPLFDADGGVESVVFSLSDITERAERERDLEQARTEYEQLIDGMNDAAWVVGTDGSFLKVNDAAVETTGYSRSELLSMGLHDIDPSLEDGALTPPGVTLSDDGPQVFETIHETKDGTRIPVEINTSFVSFRGQPAALCITRDISGRKRRERRLEEFASVVSHDLRNPLNVARGSVELAQAEHPSEHLDRAERAHTRMQELINDLLTLARQGGTVTDPEAIELRSFVETCWQHVATGDATLRVRSDVTIRADRGRLRQLFENLMRNSVEHSTDAVTVTVGALPDGFYVEDDGPGVPADKRATVFEAGYSTASEGTGFGLRIVTQVAEDHGWEVRLTDGTDGGARFEITGVEFED